LLGIDDFFCFQPSLSLDDTDLVDILYFWEAANLFLSPSFWLHFYEQLVYAPKFGPLGGLLVFAPDVGGFTCLKVLCFWRSLAFEGRYDCKVLANVGNDIELCNIDAGLRSRMRNNGNTDWSLTVCLVLWGYSFSYMWILAIWIYIRYKCDYSFTTKSWYPLDVVRWCWGTMADLTKMAPLMCLAGGYDRNQLWCT
jgi:hypothetical protein